MQSSTHYQAGRDWARTESFDSIARAQRVTTIATSKADPHTVLRFLLRAQDRTRLTTLVDDHFDGAPSLRAVLEFAHGAADADPRPMAATA